MSKSHKVFQNLTYLWKVGKKLEESKMYLKVGDKLQVPNWMEFWVTEYLPSILFSLIEAKQGN